MDVEDKGGVQFIEEISKRGETVGDGYWALGKQAFNSRTLTIICMYVYPK